MKLYYACFISIFTCITCITTTRAQEPCGTMPRLDSLLENNPSLRQQFEAERVNFNARIAGRKTIAARENAAEITYTIPVVFHIVLTDPSAVTDAQVLAQLDKLNQAFSGNNADSSSIPTWFKPLFAKSGIRFCLAQRTPEGAPTTGITRSSTGINAFTYDDKVKYLNSGGKDSWNTDAYYNVWICRLSDNLLGYATFPEDGDADAQGVVIDYRSLPGGSYSNYNTGKTLCHETGHYFNLYHIWGDDDGACTGTDYVDDTPNQANSSSGCSSGTRTDRCTSTGNGILYQDYMDYSYDACLLMFTPGQAERMEYALLSYRSTLLTSQACTPVVLSNYDGAIKSVYQPAQRLCSNVYSPSLTIRNEGAEPLTSCDITVLLNGESKHVYNWKGNLNSWDTTLIQLPAYTVEQGYYTLSLQLSNPNGRQDENNSNDAWSSPLLYYTAVNTVQEGFEGDAGLPEGWDVVNTSNSSGWAKTATASYAGSNSISKSSDVYGAYEWLRLPETYFANVDSAYLAFKIAAAATATTSGREPVDTLEILLSQDCGISYQSLYKKYNTSLFTQSAITTGFTPSASQWRTDTVSLLNYINKGNLLLAFRISNYNQSNVYIDNVNLFSITVNPNLKAKGFMVTPNPTSGNINVQFYPTPEKLKAVQVYTVAGQLIKNISTSSGVNNLYTFSLATYPPGVYIVRAVFSDTVLIRKVIKN